LNTSLRTAFVTGAAVPALAVAVASGMDGWARLGSALSAPTPGPAIVGLAQVVAAACGGWLATGALLTVIGELSWAGGALARWLAELTTPRCWRTAVLTVVGAGVLGSSAVAAASLPPAPHHLSSGDLNSAGRGGARPTAARVDVGSDPDVLDGLVLPDRPAGVWPPAAGRRRVVVRPGDTLWAISAESLPDGADVGAVARSCSRWYVANTTVIGSDPDLLLPGAGLRAPLPRPWSPPPADAGPLCRSSS